MTYIIHTGDCRRHMQEDIPAQSVQCVVSSPPYWGGIRDYQIPQLTWLDGWVGDFGNEPTIDMYLAHTLEIFDGLWRVLRDDGVVFWNVGDTFSSGGRSYYDATNNKGNKAVHTAPRVPNSELEQGNKCLVPHRVALALQEAGWIVRQDIIWSKRSPMPESVNGVRWERCRVKVRNLEADARSKKWGGSKHSSRSEFSGRVCSENPHKEVVWEDCPGCHKCQPHDGYVLRRGSWRPTNAHEYIFMLTKSNNYFCDAEAVKEPTTGNAHSRGHGVNSKCTSGNVGQEKQNSSFSAAVTQPVETRNPRSVWTLSNEPYKGAHFAAFPTALVYKCLQAAVSQHGCCANCGACFAPIVQRTRQATRPGSDTKTTDIAETVMGNRDPQRHISSSRTIGARPTCTCQDAQHVPCTVYDPFSGSGTTMQVAHWMGLNAVGSELGEQYLPLIHERIQKRPKCLTWKKIINSTIESSQQRLFWEK